MRRWTRTVQTDRVGRPNGKEFSMGFRRRTRRRALVAGAVAGGAIAHHEAKKAGEQQQYDDQAPADDQAAADEIEHLAQLHSSGALSDEEFTAAKAKLLGT